MTSKITSLFKTNNGLRDTATKNSLFLFVETENFQDSTATVISTRII
jgi:hypothetical protein